jgi:hypothetical protein
MKSKSNLSKFNAAMDTILKADPARVKANMEKNERERLLNRKPGYKERKKMEGDPSGVADIYGNNAAAICPSCSKAFVFSSHLNSKSGRVCPHCAGSKAILSEGHLTVTLQKGEVQ